MLHWSNIIFDGNCCLLLINVNNQDLIPVSLTTIVLAWMGMFRCVIAHMTPIYLRVFIGDVWDGKSN